MISTAIRETPERVEMLRQLSPTTSATEIARRIGCDRSSLTDWAKKHGIKLLSHAEAQRLPAVRALKSQRSIERYTDPDERQKQSERLTALQANGGHRSRHLAALRHPDRLAKIRSAAADPLIKAKRVISRYCPDLELPRWLPPDLALRYVAIARRHGEEDAAAWARNEKRERAKIAAG